MTDITTALPCTRGCKRRGRHHEECDPKTGCKGCVPRTVTFGLEVCHPCARRVHEGLDELPDLYDELLEPAAAGSREGDADSESVLPLSDANRKCRERIKGTLVAWCLVMAEDYGLTLPADDVRAICTRVVRQAERLLADPDHADQLVHDVTGMTRDARSLVSAGSSKGVRVDCVGTTPEGGRCDGRVTVTEPDQDGIITCRRCGEWGGVQWWVERAAPDVAVNMTTREASDWLLTQVGLVVAPSAIRKWAFRELLPSTGRDDKGRPLYDRVLVTELAQRHALKYARSAS